MVCTQLFGLEHPMTQKLLMHKKFLHVRLHFGTMKRLWIIFSILSINWQQLFQNWLAQESTIIELREALKTIYPPNYLHDERELRAWRALLRAAGCREVTAFSKDQSEVLYSLIIVTKIDYC